LKKKELVNRLRIYFYIATFPIYIAKAFLFNEGG